jgi:hypothetical protein
MHFGDCWHSSSNQCNTAGRPSRPVSPDLARAHAASVRRNRYRAARVQRPDRPCAPARVLPAQPRLVGAGQPAQGRLVAPATPAVSRTCSEIIVGQALLVAVLLRRLLRRRSTDRHQALHPTAQPARPIAARSPAPHERDRPPPGRKRPGLHPQWPGENTPRLRDPDLSHGCRGCLMGSDLCVDPNTVGAGQPACKRASAVMSPACVGRRAGVWFDERAGRACRRSKTEVVVGVGVTRSARVVRQGAERTRPAHPRRWPSAVLPELGERILAAQWPRVLDARGRGRRSSSWPARWRGC